MLRDVRREGTAFLFGPVKRPLPLEEQRLDDGEHGSTIRLGRRSVHRSSMTPNAVVSGGAEPVRSTTRLGFGLGRSSVVGDHSITLSARINRDAGIVRPSVFAVFALITNWNFVGSSTGKSAGLAPLRILST